jgi:DNA repair exonuclease SbcCD ATPase subunit
MFSNIDELKKEIEQFENNMNRTNGIIKLLENNIDKISETNKSICNLTDINQKAVSEYTKIKDETQIHNDLVIQKCDQLEGIINKANNQIDGYINKLSQSNIEAINKMNSYIDDQIDTLQETYSTNLESFRQQVSSIQTIIHKIESDIEKNNKSIILLEIIVVLGVLFLSVMFVLLFRNSF